MCSTHRRDDRGAAAVEFALVLPLLVVLVFGIIQFARAYNAQATIAGAARTVARDVALNDQARAQADLRTYTATLNPAWLQPVTIPTSCPAQSSITITIEYDIPLIGNLFGSRDLSLVGKGVMPCSG